MRVMRLRHSPVNRFAMWRNVKRGPSRAQFDLTGDLTEVPTGYLYTVLKHSQFKADVVVRVAEELRRRGRDTYQAARLIPGACSLCARKGIYIVGRTLFCSKHRDEACKRLAATNGVKHGAKSRAIDAELTERDRKARRGDGLRKFKAAMNRW